MPCVILVWILVLQINIRREHWWSAKGNMSCRLDNKMYTFKCHEFGNHTEGVHKWMSLFFFLRFYLFTFRERGREEDRDWEKPPCEKQSVASYIPRPGTEPQTQACGLTGNLTSNQDNANPIEPHQSGLLVFKRYMFQLLSNSSSK